MLCRETHWFSAYNSARITRNMKFKAVFLDMDGTTLDNHHEISANTIAVVRDLSARGVMIGIATGRSVANLLKYIEQMALPQPFVPLICYNGGYGFLYHQSENRINSGPLDVVYGSPLEEREVRDLLVMADELGCVAQVSYLQQNIA